MCIRDRITRCRCLSDATRELSRNDYAIALAHVNLQDPTGLSTVYEIINAAGDAAVAVLYEGDRIDIAQKTLEMGAQDCVPTSAIDSNALERVIQYAITRKGREKSLTAKGYFDSLTGLGNRTLLYDRWQRCQSRAKRASRKSGVLVIDVDNFKQLNDTHGPHTGDVLLQDLSARMKSVVRDTDVVARLGGDEFVLVLENIRTKNEIDVVRDALMVESEYSFHYDGEKITYALSIGGALSDPKDREDLMSVLRRADEEMYEFKTKRKTTDKHPAQTKPDRLRA